jgi:cell division protein FtsA
MFAEGSFLRAGAAPAGGNHITVDIARALHTPLAEAERIKALYGTMVRALSDEHELISYPSAGEEDGAVQQTSKASLAAIIRPRIQSLAKYVRDQIEGSDVGAYAGRSVVLTGGASQFAGMAEFMSSELGRSVRVASPRSISGLPPNAASPAFSAAAGLLLAETLGAEGPSIVHGRGVEPHGYLARVGTWLRQGF